MKQGILPTREKLRAKIIDGEDENYALPPGNKVYTRGKLDYTSLYDSAELNLAHRGFIEYNPLRTLAQRIAHERLREWNPVSLHSPRKR